MKLRPLARTRVPLLAVLALSAVVGLVAAKLNTEGRLDVAAATTHAFVDYADPSIVEARALPQHEVTLQQRAELFGRLMTTAPVLERIGRRAGLPPDQISAAARTTALVPISLTQPSSEERASQLQRSTLPYRLELQAHPAEPILAIYSQAPSVVEAERLADASILGLRDYLGELARRQGFPEEKQARLRQLGDAQGAVVSGHGSLLIGGITFVVAFGLALAVSLGVIHILRRRPSPSTSSPPKPTTSDPATDPNRDDWPHTRRVLPWMLAGFIALLWLVPFNTIQLDASIPFDLKLDRLVLPFVVVAWLLAFAAGGRMAPRLRLTPIHLALGAFVACAFLSVALSATDLNRTLELELALKKLPLLVAYVSVFLIVASAVRPTEVRAFMTYTLGLAVLCGIGIIWEYRVDENLFTIWSERLLPGGFSILSDVSGAASLDSLGRRGIVGPAEAGLEAVTMLSMALPIALVGLLRGSSRDRILYGLAACVLIAAIFATGRKSALLAPLAVVLTLAYFRRRELLTLAPLGLIIGIVAVALSPGAVQGTIAQFFRSDAASVATTSDRTADYDAVRPDLWTHLLFGRGYGSYDPGTYRIIDSEILGRTIEMGVVGLLAFLLVGGSVVLAARPTIIGRDPTFAPLALIGAAVAVCFLTVAALFDVLGFPHATYIFLCMAGFVAVVVARDREPDPVRPAHERRTQRRGRRRGAPEPGRGIAPVDAG
jgi:hypothetical protein